MRIAMAKYQQMKRSAIMIQSYHRGHQLRKCLREREIAARKIQAFWRGRLYTRKLVSDFKVIRENTIKIQSWFRMVSERKRFVGVRRAVIALQALRRGYSLRRELQRKRDSAARIQSFWRGYQEMRRQRIDFVRLRSCVLQMQSRVRMISQRRKYCEIKKSVLLIQSSYRQAKAKARHEERLKAIICLQQFWRSRQLAKNDRSRYLKLQESSIVVQSQWRMIMARRRFVSMQKCAIVLQRNIRRIIAERNYARMVERKQLRQKLEVDSARKIQNWFRQIQMQKRDRCQYLYKRNLVIFLQSRVRMKRCRKRFTELRNTVARLESAFLMKQQRNNFLKARCSARLIQRWYRGCLTTRQAVDDYQSQRAAAVKIQALVRRHNERKRYVDTQRKIILMQANVRRFIAQQRYRKLKKVTVAVQRRVKARIMMRETRMKFVEQRNAVVAIQSWWRMVSHRESYLFILQTITFIQAHARRYLALKRFRELRKSTVFIQRTYRKKRDERMERNRFLEMKASAILIQSHWRGHRARHQYKKDVQSVLQVQAQVRGFLARRRLDHLKQMKLKESSAIRIQCWYRRMIAVRVAETARREMVVKSAAINIQRAVRGYLVRRRFVVQRKSAVVIQERWRSYKLGRQERTKFLATKNAALTVQKQWRMYTCRKEYAEFRKKVITCQSTVRMWKERKRLHAILESVTIIQTHYRAHKLRQSQQLEYTRMKNSVVRLQSWIRMVRCRDQYQRTRMAAITIQSALRGFIAQKRYALLRKTTIVVQCRRRALMQTRQDRERFLAARSAAIVIQSEWRKCVCYFQFRRIQEAALTIQKYYRGHRDREYCRRKRSALLVIQKTLRTYREMKVSREEFLSKRRSIINMQRICRAYLARQEHRKLKEDAVYREQCRRESARKEEERKNFASKTIIRTLRRVIWKKKVLKRIESATTIQKYWRSYRTRLALKEKWIGITTQLKEIRARLEEATAKAEPKDRLGHRTASAIDYLFCIKDVAELIFAVKTLDTATRLSEDCCRKLSEGANQPLSQLVHLAKRCNRSVPHVEVVTISLDILINIARVDSTKEEVANIPNLVGDLFQLMQVFRDSTGSIFNKACALLQLLSKNQQIRPQLLKPDVKKKLTLFQEKISTKQKLKEECQKRRSYNPGSMPPPLSQIKQSSGNTTLNTTSKMEAKKRKGSSSVAAGPPWKLDRRPRFHEDPNTAVSALLHTLDLLK